MFLVNKFAVQMVANIVSRGHKTSIFKIYKLNVLVLFSAMLRQKTTDQNEGNEKYYSLSFQYVMRTNKRKLCNTGFI
jgi:hypothetical protein